MQTQMDKVGSSIKSVEGQANQEVIILEKSFLKLPKVLKHSRNIKNLADFYKKWGELDETVNNINEKIKNVKCDSKS